MANAAQQVLTNLRVQTTYKLAYPITKPDGETLTELQVRRIKAKDMREFEAQNFDEHQDGIRMANFYILRLTNLVPEDLDEMDACDYNKLTKLIIELVKEGKSEE